jgi:hypothetical protein
MFVASTLGGYEGLLIYDLVNEFLLVKTACVGNPEATRYIF